MGGYLLKERWGQFRSNLRKQWVKFRAAHLVQDEQYDENADGQFPRPHAATWGYSVTGQRMGAGVSSETNGAVHAFTKLSMEDRDTVGVHISEKVLVPNTPMDTTISTALVPGGALFGGSGDCRSHGSVTGL